eukprot:GHVU01142019.1.p3 GENE.GHVU01142019.1~~GHVU01142019.1.p3  ORF type:complete len:160 (+),score=38.13 GHVU01142019.1:2737-3216(+)
MTTKRQATLQADLKAALEEREAGRERINALEATLRAGAKKHDGAERDRGKAETIAPTRKPQRHAAETYMKLDQERRSWEAKLMELRAEAGLQCATGAAVASTVATGGGRRGSASALAARRSSAALSTRRPSSGAAAPRRLSNGNPNGIARAAAPVAAYR